MHLKTQFPWLEQGCVPGSAAFREQSFAGRVAQAGRRPRALARWEGRGIACVTAGPFPLTPAPCPPKLHPREGGADKGSGPAALPQTYPATAHLIFAWVHSGLL